MATIVDAEASKSCATPQLAALFDDLVRVETRLYNALNDSLRQACGITTSQYEFLDYLARHPASRVVDLANYFAIGLGATSKGMDRLMAAGWVRREPNPDDGRSSLLRLTDSGAALVGDAGTVFDEVLGRLLGSAADLPDVSRLATVLHDLRDALESERIGTPTG